MNKKVWYLNLSNNFSSGSDNCVDSLYNSLKVNRTIKFLDISYNNIDSDGNNQILKILNQNKDIFIYNAHWHNIKNKIAIKLLQSLFKFHQKFKNSPEILKLLKEKISIIDFSNGKLDDDFCIEFSINFEKWSFLQEINVEENPKITLIGLKYIFVKLKDNVFVKNFYFQSYDRKNILNNGLAASIIEWGKYAENQNKFLKIIQSISHRIFKLFLVQPNRFYYDFL